MRARASGDEGAGVLGLLSGLDTADLIFQ
jgi:hypothetical protein